MSGKSDNHLLPHFSVFFRAGHSRENEFIFPFQTIYCVFLKILKLRSQTIIKLLFVNFRLQKSMELALAATVTGNVSARSTMKEKIANVVLWDTMAILTVHGHPCPSCLNWLTWLDYFHKIPFVPRTQFAK